VMFYSIFKHRKSLGHKPAHFHESVKVEIAWTLAPFIIVIFMAIPATKTVIAQKDTSNADLTIKVTGHQWRWGYDYIKGEGEGISFISSLDNSHRILSNSGAKGDMPDDYLLKVDNPLVVPVGKKNSHHHHSFRRDPCICSAFVWYQARRHSWFCSRHPFLG